MERHGAHAEVEDRLELPPQEEVVVARCPFPGLREQALPVRGPDRHGELLFRREDRVGDEPPEENQQLPRHRLSCDTDVERIRALELRERIPRVPARLRCWFLLPSHPTPPLSMGFLGNECTCSNLKQHHKLADRGIGVKNLCCVNGKMWVQ